MPFISADISKLTSRPFSTPINQVRSVANQAEMPTPNGAYSLRSTPWGDPAAPVIQARKTNNGSLVDVPASDIEGTYIGPELTVNGDFSVSSGWSLGPEAWSITGGQLVCDGSQSTTRYANQNNSVYVGKTYVLRLDIDSCSNWAKFGMRVGQSSTNYTFEQMDIRTPGVHYVFIDGTLNAGASGFRFFCFSGGHTVAINSVSAIEYQQSPFEASCISIISSSVPFARADVESATVSKIYNQASVASDLVEANAGNGPVLVKAGVVNRVNGRAALQWNGSRLQAGDASLGTARHDSFVVAASDQSDIIQCSESNSGNNYGWVGQSGNASNLVHNNYGTPSLFVNGVQPNRINNRNFIHGHLNGGQKLISTIDATTAAWSNFTLFGYGSSYVHQGTFQELLTYDLDVGGSRALVEANINNYYNIF